MGTLQGPSTAPGTWQQAEVPVAVPLPAQHQVTQALLGGTPPSPSCQAPAAGMSAPELPQPHGLSPKLGTELGFLASFLTAHSHGHHHAPSAHLLHLPTHPAPRRAQHQLTQHLPDHNPPASSLPSGCSNKKKGENKTITTKKKEEREEKGKPEPLR